MSLSDIQKYITNEQQYINKGAIKLDEPTNKYNSHSYAWYNQKKDVNNKVISNEDVKKYNTLYRRSMEYCDGCILCDCAEERR